MKIKNIVFFVLLSVSFDKQAVGAVDGATGQKAIVIDTTADQKTKDEVSFFRAVIKRDHKEIDRCLQAGVDVNERIEEKHFGENGSLFFYKGWTALHIAACNHFYCPIRGRGGKPSPLGEDFSKIGV